MCCGQHKSLHFSLQRVSGEAPALTALSTITCSCSHTQSQSSPLITHQPKALILRKQNTTFPPPLRTAAIYFSFSICDVWFHRPHSSALTTTPTFGSASRFHLLLLQSEHHKCACVCARDEKAGKFLVKACYPLSLTSEGRRPERCSRLSEQAFVPHCTAKSVMTFITIKEIVYSNALLFLQQRNFT